MNDETQKKSFKLPPRAYERKKIPLGHLQLLLHIDHSKITNISQSVKDELAKGYVIPQDSGNVWVNDKGEWESGNYGSSFKSSWWWNKT
ncbi:hypothetical protein ONA23_06985 [Mycoplasmopsis cynos]|uniref:hypothetical protein n=1 Tax=Mycoplasmopsis cynos TaxID=171284 RepID=UPI0024C741AB|nr:hypothetical protein [Mycoplasmopsis cynos]WAM06633.1 hypothetical protein ONA23_06985 [Mycoplasmopsis cynos]